VLSALADLWGWEVGPNSKGDGYRLGRGRFPAPTDAADLHRKLRACIPPAIRNSFHENPDELTEREQALMKPVFQDAERVAGREWKEVPVARLEADNQQRLAIRVAVTQFQPWHNKRGRHQEPPAWITQPERCVFTLNGEILPGTHPLIYFDSGGGGGWGWKVGTDTLGD
jgi:hypothetical protein